MEINVGEEQIVELQSPFLTEQIQEMALAKRVDAFGQMIKFIQRPKPEDIEITATQQRLEPFWFAAARACYEYDRRHTYHVDVAPEVRSVALYENDHPTTGDRSREFTVNGVERCVEEFSQALLLDAQRGVEVKFEKYLGFPKRVVPDLAALERDDVLATTPEVRGSFVVRKLVSLLIKTFQADRVLQERIDVEQVVLYYRPVFAVEFLWKPKDKRQVLEIDGLTGDAKAESGEIKKQMARVLENDALFDIGADVVGTLFPGVNIAVKLGRLAARKAIK